jgi:hypothetical protein
MNMSQTPPTAALDDATQQPRCFVVPQAVAESTVRYMLTQTYGLNPDGTVAYKYTSWWDFLLQSFVATNIMPMLDRFPPQQVQDAQAKVDAANAELQAAKAAAAGILSADQVGTGGAGRLIR